MNDDASRSASSALVADLETLTAAAEDKLAKGTLVQAHVALELALRAQTELLSSTRGELDHLIYLASHDLRAPLRGITHLCEWIQEDLGELVPRGRPSNIVNHIDLMRSRVRRLERLIAGLLAYSRAGRGVFGTGREEDAAPPTSMMLLCEELVRMPSELLSREEGARVTLMAGPGAELQLPSQPALRAVLVQLIGNAARHAMGNDGKVVVTVSATPTADEGRVRVVIADDGPGIDPRHHQKIWEPFQMLVSRDKNEGAGVGLAIARRVVEMHGGEVGVASSLGAGAAFSFTWPAPDPAPPPSRPSAPEAA